MAGTNSGQLPGPKLESSRYESAESSPGYMFWKAFHAWQRSMRASLEVHGITQVQYSILATASYLSSASDAVSQQDVATRLAMDKMMVSDVVKSLEARSLILRRRNANDGRSYDLQLTSRARALLARVIPVVESVDERYFGVLSKADRRAFLSCLARLQQGG